MCILQVYIIAHCALYRVHINVHKVFNIIWFMTNFIPLLENIIFHHYILNSRKKIKEWQFLKMYKNSVDEKTIIFQTLTNKIKFLSVRFCIFLFWSEFAQFFSSVFAQMRNFAVFASKFTRNLWKFASDGNPNLDSLKW